LPRLEGPECLFGGGCTLPNATVLDFWRWAFGDLCPNNIRGVFAEWLVATLLGLDLTVARDPWDSHDLTTPSGLKIEVKCCAYLQAWHADGAPASRIEWNVRPTQTWTAAEGYSGPAAHNAGLYVFCLQVERDAARWNALDLSQWRFHVLTKDQVVGLGVKRIALARLSSLAPQLTAAEFQQVGRAMLLANKPT
jgi:hypothetical protein